MTDEESILKGLCPACGAEDLHLGPRGGAATNFACFACGGRFNGAFYAGSQGIGLAFFERTGKVDDLSRRLFRPERAGFLGSADPDYGL